MKKWAMAQLNGDEADFDRAKAMCERQIEVDLAGRPIVPGSRQPMQHEFLPADKNKGLPAAHRFSVEFEEAV